MSHDIAVPRTTSNSSYSTVFSDTAARGLFIHGLSSKEMATTQKKRVSEQRQASPPLNHTRAHLSQMQPHFPRSHLRSHRLPSPARIRRIPDHQHRMRLGIKHPLLRFRRLPATHLDRHLRRMCQIRILQRLGEEEAGLVVPEAAAGGRVHVIQDAVPAADAGEGAQVLDGGPDVVLVLLVAGGAVGVVEGLECLGPQAVVAVLDPEAGAAVEGRLVGRQWPVLRLVLVERDPAEEVRAEASAVERGFFPVSGLGRDARMGVVCFRQEMCGKVGGEFGLTASRCRWPRSRRPASARNRCTAAPAAPARRG